MSVDLTGVKAGDLVWIKTHNGEQLVGKIARATEKTLFIVGGAKVLRFSREGGLPLKGHFPRIVRPWREEDDGN